MKSIFRIFKREEYIEYFKLNNNDDILEVINKINTNRLSYICFILLKDNKLLLCNRTYSFYYSFIISSINNNKPKINFNKIIDCINNINFIEFISLLNSLHLQKQIDLLSILPLKELNNFRKVIEKFGFSHHEYLDFSHIINKNTLEAIKQKANNVFKNFLNSYKYMNKCNKILPGGKMVNEESYIEIIKREICEEIGLVLTEYNTKYLNNELVFESLKKDSNLLPLIYAFTKDKILKYEFHNLIFILLLDETEDSIKLNFKPNHEIKNLFYEEIYLNYNKMNMDSIKKIITKYKNNL